MGPPQTFTTSRTYTTSRITTWQKNICLKRATQTTCKLLLTSLMVQLHQSRTQLSWPRASRDMNHTLSLRFSSSRSHRWWTKNQEINFSSLLCRREDLSSKTLISTTTLMLRSKIYCWLNFNNTIAWMSQSQSRKCHHISQSKNNHLSTSLIP